MAPSPAIVLAHGVYRTHNGKVAHGLVRGSDRFRVTAVVDPDSAGNDAGELLDGAHRNIPVVNSISEAVECSEERPQYCVVGVATHGGRFTPELRRWLVEAVRADLAVVNGLHDFAADDPDVASIARERGVRLIDLRRPRPRRELRFWTGRIRTVRAPRIAVLGTDCALGKRTTTRFMLDALNPAGIRTEMIYTGQTGWMQGARYGFVLDSVVNDFVCGELEHAVVSCDREANPDVILIEGQSSLRNPSGPCGAEFLVSGGARGVVLQHAPAREFFEGYAAEGFRIPPLEQEVELIGLYGARVLAITIQGKDIEAEQLARHQREMEARLDIPVVRPLEEGVDRLVPVVRQFITEERRES